MKITFLGTSHGVPEPNRRCSCTMVEVGGRYYFVDMGMNAIDELITRGIRVDAVKGVFVTHMHGDHTDGLVQFGDLIGWKFKTADPVLFLPEEAGIEALKTWYKLADTGRWDMRFEVVHPGLIYDDGILKVTAIPTRHCANSYAYLLEAEGKRVLFTGDLQHPNVDFPVVAEELRMDLMVCEGAHFPPTEYAPILRRCKPGRVVINHMGAWSVPYIHQLAKDMETIPVVMANDHMEVNL
jgi:ribonuclease BN (tRNA processing enzyme)